MNLIETLRATDEILDTRTKRSLVLAGLAALVIALFDTLAIALVLPLVTIASGGEDTSGVGGLLSRALGNPEPKTLVITMTIVVVVLFVLKDLGSLWYNWWLSGFKAFKRVDLASRLLAKFLNAPYTQISRRGTGELLRTMNDAVTQFYGTTVFGLMSLVSNFATLIAIAIALLMSAPLPSLALGLYFGIASLLYVNVLKPRLQAAGATAAEASADAYGTALAALGGIKETQLRGSQRFFLGNYRAAAQRGARAARTADFVAAAPRYLLEILFILAIGVFLIVMTSGRGNESHSGFGVMALFVAAGLRALPAVTSTIGQIGSLRYGAGFVGVVLDEVRRNTKEFEAEGDGESPYTERSVSGSIRFENVTFRYPDSHQDALRGVNLSVLPGESIAVVGGSGAGKTTLVDVLLGLHKPTVGRVTIDGLDIQENLRAWQRSVGYVPQEVYLREATLAENIAFDQAREDIDAKQLVASVQRAQLADVVAALGRGLETQIGERGSRLSGGQRQRVGIARSLYRQPSLLVLDEATSALDNETEHRVNEAIRELHGALTIVVVAHRLSTVKHVDSIVLMNDGAIECIGTFEELKSQSPRFARMVQLGSLI